MNYKKYFWILPALYVSLEFGGKFFEVLSDKVEIVDTISVIKPLSAIADYLAYGVGAFDLLFAVTLLTCSYAALSKKYYPYLFAWAAIWPFVPACFRYFG